MKQQNWDGENISDQNGKVVVVTGSSSGLGYETAKVLANKNATVVVAVRNELKGNAAVEKIKVENPNADIQVMLVDLARNDLSRNGNTVQVETYREVQYFSHVIHLVSKVTGIKKQEIPTMKVVADTFPAGLNPSSTSLRLFS